MAHTFRQRRRGCGKRVIITWLKLRLHTEVPVESGPDERVSLRHARMSRKLRRYIGVHAEPPCHPVTDSSFIAGECSPAFSEQEDLAAWHAAADGPNRQDSEPGRRPGWGAVDTRRGSAAVSARRPPEINAGRPDTVGLPSGPSPLCDRSSCVDPVIAIKPDPRVLRSGEDLPCQECSACTKSCYPPA